MKFFKKMINNNVALVDDEAGNEFIVIGKGVAFQKKLGDIIPAKTIEKVYSQKNADKLDLVNYLRDIDYKVFTVCDEVKSIIEDTYKLKYSDFMYLSLIDHINGTISRIKLDIHVDSEISNEDLKVYTKEVWLAKKTNELINNEFGFYFDENELSFLILHFIGILYDLKYTHLNERAIQISSNILEIITDEMDIVDEESFVIKRLIIHLRYFVIRQFNKQELVTEDSDFHDELYSFLIKKNPKAERTLLKVIKYLEEEHNFEVSLDEWLYLLIHITKLLSEEINE